MRTVIPIILFLVVCTCAYGQGTPSIPKLPLQANKIVYFDTVWVPSGYTAAQLFDNAHSWYMHTYETSDDRLTIDNSDAGTLSGTGTANFKEHKTDYKDLLFTIDLLIGKGYYVYKIYNLYGYDNGIKFDYSDMYHEALYPIPKSQWPKAVRDSKLNELNQTIKAITANLETAMQNLNYIKKH